MTNTAESRGLLNPSKKFDDETNPAPRPIEKVLGALTQLGKRINEGGDLGQSYAQCPAHDDEKPSLSVCERPDGTVLINCHAGCDPSEILDNLKLTKEDLFPRPGLTLAEYAEAKRLPIDFLVKKFGLREGKRRGMKTVVMPYQAEDRTELTRKYRLSLRGDNRFEWKSGAKVNLYGLWLLDEARKRGYTVLVEGESDVHTLWLHGIPALGIPGSSTWHEDWTQYFDEIHEIYVVIEPDQGGEKLLKKLRVSSIRDRIRIVELGPTKDASELHLADPQGFLQAWQEAVDAGKSFAEWDQLGVKEQADLAWQRAKVLAKSPNILGNCTEVLQKRGVAGESQVVKLIFLSMVSRLLNRPVSLRIEGPSSAGKSFLVKKVLEFFPASAYFEWTAISDRALAYSEEPLRHRMIILYEKAGLSGDMANYLVRSLLSEGRLRYQTVEKTSQGLKPRLIEREGPTGLFITTTGVVLDRELGTRMLSIHVTDTREQTRSILTIEAEQASGSIHDKQDLIEWHALQEWLERAERRVVIPFARQLAKAVPPLAVRLRRDFQKILDLISAHALLHQATRGRDDHGRIIATLGDYAAVYDLVAGLLSAEVGTSVPDPVRETVNAVKTISSQNPGIEVSISKVASALKLDPSTASRRVGKALEHGYLKNFETKRGRQYKLAIGEPLPDEQALLPSPEVPPQEGKEFDEPQSTAEETKQAEDLSPEVELVGDCASTLKCNTDSSQGENDAAANQETVAGKSAAQMIYQNLNASVLEDQDS